MLGNKEDGPELEVSSTYWMNEKARLWRTNLSLEMCLSPFMGKAKEKKKKANGQDFQH